MEPPTSLQSGLTSQQPKKKKKQVLLLEPLKQEQRKRARSEEGVSAGPSWFDMRAPDITSEVERDLRALELRKFMDPKRFYKSDDFRGARRPKVFHLGTVIPSPMEPKSNSLTKRERKQTFADEVMSNKQISAYARRVFDEVQVKSASGGRKKRKLERKQTGHSKSNKGKRTKKF